MLKMTIDNEEVVSKNNFTIKEEMLSPSSTILNNTYPKSWEDDKNYTSRFYYPKDYAKLDIQNFSITPEEAGTTIDINGSATLTDVDTTKESRVLSLKGQTSQTGTPTPTSPIPVNVVSGDNYINICGKNLISNVDIYNGYAYATDGATLTYYSSDKTITYKKAAKVMAGIQYTISWKPNTPKLTGVRDIKIADDNAKQLQNISYNNSNNVRSVSFTPTYSGWVYACLDANATEPMLEKGSTATTYEPYIGSSYPIYLGVENLFGSTMNTTSRGVAITKGSSNIGLNGTGSSSGNINNTGSTFTLGAGTYTMAISYSSGSLTTSGTSYVRLRNSSGDAVITGAEISLTSSNYNSDTLTATFTLDQATTIYLSVYVVNTSAYTNLIYKAQIDKGTKVNHVSTTPIELCKIGTYQDYIYKDNGTWYLHKEIGKVVLDGTENWGYSGAQTAFYVDIANNVSGNRNVLVCDKYTCVVESTGTTMPNNTIMVNANNNNRLVVKDTRYTDTTTYTAWLVNNNVIVYHPLATPTTTLITDTTLLEQLDALESQ